MPESLGEAHIRAYCRSLVTDLPRGVLGCAIAAEILLAIPEAPRRRLPDVTGSAPEIFRALVTWGLLRSMPSARVMTLGGSWLTSSSVIHGAMCFASPHTYTAAPPSSPLEYQPICFRATRTPFTTP